MSHNWRLKPVRAFPWGQAAPPPPRAVVRVLFTQGRAWPCWLLGVGTGSCRFLGQGGCPWRGLPVDPVSAGCLAPSRERHPDLETGALYLPHPPPPPPTRADLLSMLGNRCPQTFGTLVPAGIQAPENSGGGRVGGGSLGFLTPSTGQSHLRDPLGGEGARSCQWGGAQYRSVAATLQARAGSDWSQACHSVARDCAQEPEPWPGTGLC